MQLKKCVVKKDVYNAKIKNNEDKIHDIINIATNTSLNANISEVKGETHNISNSATTTALSVVENKISNFSNLVRKKLTTQTLEKLKIKLLLVMIMINILLLKNLISYHQQMFLQDSNKQIQQAKMTLLIS